MLSRQNKKRKLKKLLIKIDFLGFHFKLILEW